MPSLADISVKKADETTSITYSGVIPSSGDKSPALWRCTSVGSAPGHNPSFKLASNSNSEGTTRRVQFSYAYPQTATATDGSVSVVNVLRLDGSVVIPQGMPQTTIDEGVAQAMNLLASTLVKASCKAGFAPT